MKSVAKGIPALDLRSTVPALLALLLAAVAYRLLFDFSPAASLEAQAEEFMFNNTASGPPVVLVLAAWLVYRRWPSLRALGFDRASPGVAAGWFAPCLPILAWSCYTGSADLLIVGLILHAVALALGVWGVPGLRVLWVPIAFLAFGIHAPAPLINEVLWKFQIWTADYTGFLLQSLGLTTYVTGEQLIRPDNTFAIIETCSGLRSFESLTMLTVLMIDLFGRTRLHAAILLGLAPPVAFAVNGLRAVTIILNPHSEVVGIHTLQGISVLMVGLLLLYVIDGWLERLLPTPALRRRPLAQRGAAELPRAVPRGALVASALLAALSFAVPRWEAPERGARPFPSNQIPVEFEGWTSTEMELDRQFMGIVSFRAWVDRRYERGDDAVRLLAGVGGHDKARSSPFSPKTALPGSGWWVEQTGWVTLDPDARRVRARVVRYGNAPRRKLVFDWREGTNGFADEVYRAALSLDKSAWVREREGVSLRISTRLDDLSDSARRPAEARLREFYRTFRPRFDLLGTPRGD